tara:strand:+ start:656 stop:934 length:279 start_codon:yes stop_codon:yes gene_type:complete
MKLLHINSFLKNKKIVCLSILTNAVAIALSFIIGILYTSYKQQSYIEKEDGSDLKWYDYIVALLLSIATAITSYTIVFVFSGYLPMSRIKFV